MDIIENKTAKTPDFEPFDLAALETASMSNQGIEIELKTLDGKATGILWGILGMDGEVFRTIMKDRADDEVRREAAAARRGEEVEPLTADQKERNSVELLAACSTHWRSVKRDAKGEIVAEVPYIVLDGKKYDFNVPNTIEILTNVLRIRKQVDNGVGNVTLFTKP